MSQLDVSVIIATYNAMPYLRDAVSSLLRQTIGLDRFEVLIVDDGSTDESAEYLTTVATEFPHIQIVHQPNSGGPGGPRNRAINLATGRYLFVLDADDWISDDALSAMVDYADMHDIDVLTPKQVGVGGRDLAVRVFEKSNPDADIVTLYRIQSPMKLFRRSLISDHSIEFPAHMRRGQDRIFVTEAYFAASKLGILADKDYVYIRFREDGANITSSLVQLRDLMPSCQWMFEYTASHTKPGPKRDALMLRNFRVEATWALVEGYSHEPVGAYRDEIWAWMRTVVKRYYTPAIAHHLPPESRALFWAIRRNNPELLLSLAKAYAGSKHAHAVTKGGRTYLDITGFAHGDKSGALSPALPNHIFEVAPYHFGYALVDQAQVHGSQLRIDVTVKTLLDPDWIRAHAVSWGMRCVRTGGFVSGGHIASLALDATTSKTAHLRVQLAFDYIQFLSTIPQCGDESSVDLVLCVVHGHHRYFIPLWLYESSETSARPALDEFEGLVGRGEWKLRSNKTLAYRIKDDGRRDDGSGFLNTLRKFAIYAGLIHWWR